MADNSNPQGTGTDTDALGDAGLEAFLGESFATDPKDEENPDNAGEKPDGEKPDGEEAETNPEEALLTLPNGEEIKWKDLQERMMLKEDYTRKTQGTSAKERDLDAKLARTTEQARLIDEHSKQLETAFENVLAFTQSQLPAEPDPNLAMTNVNAYIQQKAYYDRALQQVMAIAEARNQKMTAIQQKAQENQKVFMTLETQKLEEAFPQLRGKPDKAQEFHANNKAILRQYGIPEQEYDGLASSGKRVLARLAYLEAKEKARTTTNGNASQTQMPAARVQPRGPTNQIATKSIQAFRQSGSADAAKAALESGAFDQFLK